MNDNTTIHAIAGYCNEKVLWKLLADLSSELLKGTSKMKNMLTPDMVMIDGENFRIVDKILLNSSSEFCPPEGVGDDIEKGLVWSLAGLACYASSGHYVFGCRGGVYQRSNPKVDLPALRREHSSLTPVIKRCLCYSPSQRITLSELHAIAKKGLDSNEQLSRQKRTVEPSKMKVSLESLDDVWPEKMI